MHVIEVSNVSKTFDKHRAVDDLSLVVPRGAIYGFIGPNGSGKTTTLRMIMRIYHPDPGVGTVCVLGRRDFGAANNRIGYLPEERGLYKKMRVREILGFMAELKGLRRWKPDVDDWLEKMSLSEWAGKRVETLSKGMAQKVQFIAAVIARPELLILDEPFSGLDPINADLLRECVIEMHRHGTTIIFSTHDMAVAEKMCDFILMIYKGKKVLDGTLDSIQNAYGQDTLRVRLESNHVDLRTIHGVEKVTDFGQLKELRVADGADTQEILTGLMGVGRVTHFELSRPSLRDIFVRIASPAPAEIGHA